MTEGYTCFASAGAGQTGSMSEKPTEQTEEEEVELEEQNGELLPDREAMSILDPSSGITGNLGPPVLDDPTT
jgi:hypothetical protein